MNIPRDIDGNYVTLHRPFPSPDEPAEALDPVPPFTEDGEQSESHPAPTLNGPE